MQSTADPTGGDPDETGRVVGKKQLSELLGWSRTTLDRRLSSDANFPIRTRGDRGGGWAFDVEAVRAYLQPAAKAGGTPRPAGPGPHLRVVHEGEETSRQRRDAAQAMLLEDRLRKQRSQLLEAEEVRLVLGAAAARLNASLAAFPEILVRRLDLPEAATDVIRQEVEQTRRQMHANLRELLNEEIV